MHQSPASDVLLVAAIVSRVHSPPIIAKLSSLDSSKGSEIAETELANCSSVTKFKTVKNTSYCFCVLSLPTNKLSSVECTTHVIGPGFSHDHEITASFPGKYYSALYIRLWTVWLKMCVPIHLIRYKT